MTNADCGIRNASRAATQHMAKYLLLLLVVFCGSGATCSRSLRNPFMPQGPPSPDVLLAGASLDQVISAVNLNAGRVQSYQTNNASITIPGMTAIPILRGNIVAQRPGRLRLQASTALLGPEVDMGSNDELFWFWVKRNEPPALYFSRHDQFVGSAAQQVMPIDPKWVLDAIGMAQFSPQDQHQGPLPHGDGTLEILSIIQSPTGTLTKSTVIDARKAWVLEQHIYDSRGQLLVSTRASRHRYYPGVNVSLPQEVEIRVPSMPLALTIDVGTVYINQVADNPALWALPVLSGYPQINLGSALPGTIPVVGSAGNSFSSPAAEAMIPTQTVPSVLPANPNQSPSIYATPATSLGPTISAAPISIVVPPSPAELQPVARQLPPGGIPASSRR